MESCWHFLYYLKLYLVFMLKCSPHIQGPMCTVSCSRSGIYKKMMGVLGAVHISCGIIWNPTCTQSILIIHGFCIWKFAYLIKFFVTSKSVLIALLQSLADMHRAAKIWSCPTYTPSWGPPRQPLPSCFSAQTVNVSFS